MKILSCVLFCFLLLPEFNLASENQYVFNKNAKISHSEIDPQYTRFTPSRYDVDLADSLTRTYIKKSRNKYPWTDEIKNYDLYYRQYVGYLNINHEKTIFINSFCKADADWKQKIIQAHGGGSCNFNIKVDLSSQKAFNLNVNTAL